VDGDDVRVAERGGQLGFLKEPLLAFRIGDRFPAEYLDGHASVQVHIERAVHHAHAAFTNLGVDPVMG
jgi:hypothetical protein